eukprot:gnl/TRDRNA2_/TRDRNA2_92453_c0_seq2.p1 gnl/TRDRNA2_/TRDRNA2_92453_c0~~gnl/TRDRNA2_/TRDRNA2_92453_c0_seq2.p1  ORF type:complete len:368 (+),score=39.86 gnl/TRDRNA2_/TRDRNA2_92453_c0_seq2:140-1243(+)
MQVCRDNLGCSTHLKVALLQAKEFNPDVILVEQGGACAEWCQENGIAYQDIPWKDVGKVFCNLMQKSQMMLRANPGRKDSVFLMAALRWPLLDHFLQGRIKKASHTIDPPQRFNMCDHDVMVYVNSAWYFERFGEAEMAICTHTGVTNGIYSLFLKDSFHDLATYYLDSMPRFRPPWGSDMDVLSSYAFGEVPMDKDASSHVPRHIVYNSCLSFPDGRVSEYVNTDKEGIYEGAHSLFYRKGQLHYRLKKKIKYPVWKPVQRDPYQRQFAIHFQGGSKKIMRFHFRPDIRYVEDEGCRACLLEDCDCDDLKCMNCWMKCLPRCEVLQSFEAKVNMSSVLEISRANFSVPFNESIGLRSDTAQNHSQT